MTANARYAIVRANQRAEKPWVSGFCTPGNPLDSHRRCISHPRRDGKPCSCSREGCPCAPKAPATEEAPSSGEVSSMPGRPDAAPTASPAPRSPVITDLPEEEYHRHPALSSSGARLLLPPNCPAIYRWRMNHPETSDAFDIGHAAHMLALGAGAPIYTLDADDWRTKAAKEEAAGAREFGMTPLLKKDHEKVLAMAERLREHPIAGRLFAPGAGRPEVSLFWTDDETGVDCRARLDWLPPTQASGRVVVADYKTTAKPNPRYGFGKTVADFGYMQQDAWYCEGVRAAGLADDVAFVFVVQSKVPPYLVHVAQLDAEAQQIGHNLNRKARAVFADCTRTDTWPDESGSVELVSLPSWYLYQHAEEIHP